MHPRPSRNRLIAAVATIGAVAAVLVPFQQGASAVAYPAAGSVAPTQDPFYQPPANLASLAPGAVVATRPATFTYKGLAATATQIAYRTNDSRQHAQLTVTTLFVPTAAWTGGGARPGVSLQWAEDSTGLQCAPSYQVATNGTYAQQTLQQVAVRIARGWAVALPDFLGPKSAFMAGYVAGYGVLDGIRAVKSLNRFGIGTTNPWALDGYSGGANASGWAAQLQPTYAPDVTLVGTALGGTPADPVALSKAMDGGPFAGLEIAAALSLSKEYPDANMNNYLNTLGRLGIAVLDGQCTYTILALGAFRHIGFYMNVPDPFAVPSIAAVMRENTLGLDGTPAPGNAIYDYHAAVDEVVVTSADDTMVKNWCSRGATISVRRDTDAEHLTEMYARVDSVLSFLADRFAGKKPTNNC